ncbi:hypothetical protein QAD02_011478 [Eretmocerus hayati]|uniref:Uncharacterized protein n=1 Tax=Eretmocerus hayati TaxID=131215 RepID=A0ACC2NX42_9HYME|nr:hypothetical protein QAD02_011478 [Eretmocerus hayati]
MESHLSPKFKKWMKKCLSDEFSKAIDNHLNGDRDPYDVAQKIINSSEMTELTHAIRTSFVEQIDASRTTTRQNSALNSAAVARNSVADSRPQTALSFLSDLSGDEWSLKENTDEIGQIVECMGYDKPDHVRLASYEALLENGLSNLSTNNSWPALLRALKDGLIDGSRSVFEESLLIHAKLLSCPQFSDAYMNLLSAFTDLYHSKKLSDTLPTLLSGVNFKIFLHEKLFRVMKLILDHHDEILKGFRTTDKPVEDMIEHFVSLLCSQSIISTNQKKPLSTLHILSVIEPIAGWSKKWMHGLITRRALCNAISKSPSLIQEVVSCVKKGLENPPTGFSVVINDPSDVFISGDSVETFTFLHCLHLLTQLCSYSTGRSLLSETLNEDTFSMPDFMLSLLTSLNILASSEASNSVYESIRVALSEILKEPNVLYDARFYHIALSPLMKSEIRVWPHTIDVLNHMLDTVDGASFLMSEYRVSSGSMDRSPNYPVLIILTYASNILKQTIAVMSIEHVVDLFKFIGNLFHVNDIFYTIEEVVRETFYPNLSYMFSKLDKYYVENEGKTQRLDKVTKEMLLKIVSVPLGLQMLSNEPLVFEELVRGSIVPLRASWSAYDVVGFIANSGFLSHGVQILENLAPHALSTVLVELSKLLEDPQQFHDPWENADVNVFLHVLALFSLNTNSFIAFMVPDDDEEDVIEDNVYLTNLYGVFLNFLDVNSPYHHLGLLSLKAVYWNLDIYVYLINLLDFKERLLELQYDCKLSEEDSGTKYAVDELSALRHTILLGAHYIRPKRNVQLDPGPEQMRLFSSLPPPPDSALPDEQQQQQQQNQQKNDRDEEWREYSDGGSELAVWLSDDGPALRDFGWILQTRNAHKHSPERISNSTLISLLNQMEQAIPTIEWLEPFEWNTEMKTNDDYWLPEENCGIDLVIHYCEINCLLKNQHNEDIKTNLKLFIQLSYGYIKYKKSLKFEGFDWFLATVFLICDGDIEKAKMFISQILRLPSTTYMWPALGTVIDENHEEEASSRLLFAHLLESIVALEFPTIKFTLKNECGLDWWMICDRLLSQCFWGILPWAEILHYFAICIMYSADYILYYCASILNHCDSELLKSITKGQMWPEGMVLEDYRSHAQISFMDRLGKRYGGKVLPPLTQRKFNQAEDTNSTIERSE